jgi:hypothetical protein
MSQGPPPDEVKNNATALPWLAGLAGLSAASTILIASKFEFSVKGAYVTCQLGSKVASGTLSAGTLTASRGNHVRGRWHNWGRRRGRSLFHSLEEALQMDDEMLAAVCCVYALRLAVLERLLEPIHDLH